MSTTYRLLPTLRQRFFDANGDPLAGGMLYSYIAGTSTPTATYTDNSGGTPNTNPVVLDANGEANVWIGPGSFKFILTDADGVTQWTEDNVTYTNGLGASDADAAAASAAAAAASAASISGSVTTAAASATAAASSATAAAGSATTATTQATNAASSASGASTSASGASTSASNASTSATNASNSATAAATSATNASNSATAASTSATNAANSATAASGSASTAASAVSTHAALTTTHGVTGSIVGTSDTQTLTNKTMSGSSNTFSNIPNSATTATSANTASAIVARDGSGNFTAGTITANLTGTVTGTASGDIHNTLTSTTGDMIYASSANTPARLAGPTSSTKQFLTSTGTGSAAQAPAWGAIAAGDVPTLNQNTTGSAASFTGSLAGDVTGTQGATVVGKINGTALSGLATGILKNTTTTGVPSIAVAGDFPTLNQNTTGTAASVTGTNVVANSNLSQMATNTIKGNNTGSTANAADLTATQVTAMLNAVVGDSGSGGTKGLVPAPASGDAAANKFLKANGSWATTPAAGALSITTQTANYTATSSDDVILCNTNSFTITLPAASAYTKVLRIKNIGTSTTITIARAGSDLIDGSASSKLIYANNDWIELISDGSSNWRTINFGFDAKFFAATSSTKTPSASGNYSLVSGNNISLTPGSWVLTGAVTFGNSGAPAYTEMVCFWAAANGADSATPPTALTNDAGFNTIDVLTSSVSFGYLAAQTIRITTTSSKAVYLVPYATMTTAANARITCYVYAERLA